ncbi:MAG: tyrosine-type recombinase/integrase [Actinomycetota bacterium]
MGHDRNVYVTTAPTMTAASEAKARVDVAVKDGTFVSGSGGRELFTDEMEGWLTDHIDDSAMVGSSQILLRGQARHVQAWFEGYAMRGVTTDVAVKFLREMRDAHSARIYRATLQVANGTMQRATVAGKVAFNPFSKDRITRPKPRKAPATRADRAWPLKTLVLHESFETDDVFYPAYMAGQWLGLRSEEAAGLQVSDVVLTGDRPHRHADGDKPHVCIQRVRAREGSVVTVRTPKTDAGTRTVSLPARMERILRAHRANNPAIGDAWLFTDAHGEPINPSRLGDAWASRVKRFMKANPDIERIGLHGLRHSWVTVQLMAGKPLVVVSKMAGHASLAITADVYSHLLSEAGAESVSVFDEGVGS